MFKLIFLIFLTTSSLINLSYQSTYDRFDHLHVNSFNNKNRKEVKFEPLGVEEIENYFQIYKNVCFN
jgi:hypothetical protein